MNIESEIVAIGSVRGVMTGKHNNRTLSMRSHKTVSEALHRIRFKAFLSTLTEAEQIQACNVIKDLTEKYSEEAFLVTVTSDEFNQIFENYSAMSAKVTAHVRYLHCGRHWSSYIEMVQQLLLFV